MTSDFLIFLFNVLFLTQCQAKQRTIVYGQLMCDGKPYSGATVKLYDSGKPYILINSFSICQKYYCLNEKFDLKLWNKKPTGSDTIKDSLMAKNETKQDGQFYVDGTARDLLSSIDPRLYIYHKM